MPKLRTHAAYAKQAIHDKLLEHTQYITEHGEGLPEVHH
jgi:xylulose-5-phosphate/fructose-6-phosphate phosphoketolase